MMLEEESFISLQTDPPFPGRSSAENRAVRVYLFPLTSPVLSSQDFPLFGTKSPFFVATLLRPQGYFTPDVVVRPMSGSLTPD